MYKLHSMPDKCLILSFCEGRILGGGVETLHPPLPNFLILGGGGESEEKELKLNKYMKKDGVGW